MMSLSMCRQSEGPRLQNTEQECSGNGNFLPCWHLQLPDRSLWQCEDDKIGKSVDDGCGKVCGEEAKTVVLEDQFRTIFRDWAVEED